jgi:hypothetical protein
MTHDERVEAHVNGCRTGIGKNIGAEPSAASSDAWPARDMNIWERLWVRDRNARQALEGVASSCRPLYPVMQGQLLGLKPDTSSRRKREAAGT